MATVNVAVEDSDRCFPLALVTPPLPPGTVRVSVVEGTKGDEATKAKVSAVISCHVPATAGVRDGVAEWGSRGSEKCTDTVASVGTSVAPAAGVVVTTARGPSWAAASTAWTAVVVGDAAARLAR